MEILKQLLQLAGSLVPTAAAIAGTVLVALALRYVLEKRYAGAPGTRFRIQITILILSLVGLLVVIIVLPVSESLRGQLLGLIGILLSAAVALSSTTFIGNIMAGLMLRVVRNFRPGDFIHVEETFGRVTEQSLFHVEIQTEDRDLTTMPNLHLVTRPVKVIRASGTVISAEVSLGYDLPRSKIEPLLIQAASEVPLRESFVHVLDLGNFSVTYRVAGLLDEVKQILSARSRLRQLILDKLHGAGVEIVSPTFMNTRAIDGKMRFVPPKATEPPTAAGTEPKPAPEKVVFDKADKAESLEKLRERYEALKEDAAQAEEELREATDQPARDQIKARIERMQRSRQDLGELIQEKEKEQQD